MSIDIVPVRIPADHLVNLNGVVGTQIQWVCIAACGVAALLHLFYGLRLFRILFTIQSILIGQFSPRSEDCCFYRERLVKLI
jgi:succinate dehydrogenase/fumarate reductase cytochrome b subunit